ncbi:phytanoyl-CoA dioxygenase family protein [Candidatus Pelagibacter sp. HIMB1748]|uniref:phytanoyl-CoA dioxygenase family protein n=1 Tax=unclassified Candidatus Pelagibacter TaxID=2647897 RepID=UPI003F83CD08
MSKIFNLEFEKINIENIINNLNKKGYFSFNNAVNLDTLNSIENETSKSKLNLNVNKISGVYNENQFFLTNVLAQSKTCYNYITSNLVTDISEKFLGEKFKISSLRYYETYGNHYMQWHTDNKSGTEFRQDLGIIFILYISDVYDGQFQYIEGSHNWSEFEGKNNYNDEFIEKNYKEKIIDFKGPRGTLIIYNTRGIHRAKIVKDKNFIRKSLFFQVGNNLKGGAPIIINASYLKNINDKLKMFLGFGEDNNNIIYPKTSLNTLPLNKNINKLFISYFVQRLKKFVKSFLSN